MEPGKPGEKQIRLQVPLIHFPQEETSVDPERRVPLVNVDSEAMPVTVDGNVADPTSTDGRYVDLPLSLPSEVSPDGPLEMPKAKKRKVMFADE